MRKRLFTYLGVVLCLTAGAAAVFADGRAGEKINWEVVSSGGQDCGSASYRLSGTVGQTAAGVSTTAAYALNHGYWQDFGTGSCCTGPSVGNVDGSTDNQVTMGDLTVLIDHLFISYAPLVCVDAGNIDMSPDGQVTMGDLTVLIDNLFISYSPLPPCP